MKNLEQLKKDNIYRYRELCELFEEDVKSGNSKKAQLKKWGCYFKWRNISTQKFQILEIYEVPLEMEDGRDENGGNCTSQYQELDDFIMEYMSTHKKFSGTIARLLIEMELLVPDYSLHKREPEYLIKTVGFSEGVVINVFRQLKNLESSMKSALDRLSNSGHICYTTEMLLVRTTGKTEVLDYWDEKMVRATEEDVCAELNIPHKERMLKVNREKYTEAFNKQMKWDFGEDFEFVYISYTIEIMNEEYQKKKNSTIDAFTRRYVKQTCLRLMSLDFGYGFYQKESTVEQIILLTEQMFLRMTPEAWKQYDVTKLKDNNEDMVFLMWILMPRERWRQERTDVSKYKIPSTRLMKSPSIKVAS